MRAAFINAYGQPLQVVQVGEQPDPLVGPDVVLVEVAAAGVNPVDWKIVAGYLQGAFPHHLPLIPGWDVAGTVRVVGPAVTSVAVGDRVAAYARKDAVQHGTFAQLVAVPERAIAKVPDGVDFLQAAALPLAGLTAEQALDAASVKSGDRVLVHNSSGGVGTFAVQLAVLRGAQVYGTASPANHQRLVDLGVTPLDYHGDVVAQLRALAPEGVDVVVDLVGGSALESAADVLVPGGRVVSITNAKLLSDVSRAHGLDGHYVFVRPDGPMLARLLQLVGDGQLKVDISREFTLEQSAAALEYSRDGHARGKIVITVPAE